MNKLFDVLPVPNVNNSILTYLEVASKIMATKNSVALLANIAKRDNQLFATDLSSYLYMSFSNSGHVDGVYLFKMCQAMKTLTGLNLNGATLENFPEMPLIQYVDKFHSLNEKQKETLLNAYKFISDDVTRYVMNGIYFDVTGKAIATDGRRAFYSASIFPDFPNEIIKRTRCIDFILKKGQNIKYQSTKAEEGKSGTYSVFIFDYKNEHFTYVVQNIEGQFPNWSRVIPVGYVYCLQMPNLNEWKTIYNRCKQLADKTTRLQITFTDNYAIFVIATENDPFMEIGKIEWHGEVLDTCNQLLINYEYLNDLLLIPGLQKIYFNQENFEKVLLFEYKNGDHSVLMPMQRDATS